MVIKDKNITNRRNIALIKKANNLIEARYKFGIWEMRFFLYLLSKINKYDEELKEYRIWYKDIVKTFGLKSKETHKFIRNGVYDLMNRTIIINTEDEAGVKREKQYNILSYANVLTASSKEFNNQNHAYADVVLSPQVKSLLLQLQKSFTTYDLKNVVKLGVYGVRIYELLKQYENFRRRTIKISDMKVMFCIQEEYPLFANFYQKVIRPSLKDINEHTDLMVEEPLKVYEGRNVVALTFYFEPKPEDENNALTSATESSQNKENQLVKNKSYIKYESIVVTMLGVSASQFLKLCQKYKASEIEKAIQLTQQTLEQNPNKGQNNSAQLFVNNLLETNPKLKKAEERKQQELEKRINDRIRELVAQYPNITNYAIEYMKTDKYYKKVIREKTQALSRPLSIADFRQDETLRQGVIKAIILLNRIHFDDILQEG